MAFTVITYTPEPGATRDEHHFNDKDKYEVSDNGTLRIEEADGTLHLLSPTAWYEVTDGRVMLSRN